MAEIKFLNKIVKSSASGKEEEENKRNWMSFHLVVIAIMWAYTRKAG
jgi:hypothetical protein